MKSFNKIFVQAMRYIAIFCFLIALCEGVAEGIFHTQLISQNVASTICTVIVIVSFVGFLIAYIPLKIKNMKRKRNHK